MLHSFSHFPVPPANHCKKKSLEKEKDFLVIGQLPVPRTVVLELKKSLLSSAILSDGTKHNSSHSILYGLCSAPSDNANKKQFFSAIIPLSFPPLITVCHLFTFLPTCIFLHHHFLHEVCTPFFQHHSQFPPLPKFLQPMFGITFTEIGPFHSCLTCAD